ncbi:MAG: class I SAM-dependent methyltransferase, partial [Actinomycetota bacterium]|nr:class I SAM-dependent methyltransferase [Actinomycetota bacterium]
MEDLPEGFVADLRSLRSWPSLQASLWRAPYLVELTYGRLPRLVGRFLDQGPLAILDLGCGSGFLSLELARGGHRVLGLDVDEESIALARRGLAHSPPLVGQLSYQQVDVLEWDPEPETFDAVVISRVLHHLPGASEVVGRVGGWLKQGGRLVCLDFAYDLFDRRSAAWIYQMRGLLQAAGMYAGGGGPHGDAAKAVERLLEEWRIEHEVEEDLNTFEEMRLPLQSLFVEEHFSWHPYLYWELLEDLRAPSSSVEAAVAGLLADSE